MIPSTVRHPERSEGSQSAKRPQSLSRAAAILFLCALPLASAACAERDKAETVDVVATIPWTTPEAYRYVIVNSDEEPQGNGVLAVSEGANGTTLIQRFSDEDGNSDTSVLVVNSRTLRPFLGEHTIIDASDDRRNVALSRYETEDDGDVIVRIAGLSYDPADEDDPALRCSPDKVDTDHYYDNDSSLFLWRTVTFEEGWTALYTNVLSNRRVQRTLELRVSRKEQVTTPAGEFEAWRLDISGEGSTTQTAWFATTPDHKLLVYNNRENQIFLYAGETGVPDVDAPAELPAECVDE